MRYTLHTEIGYCIIEILKISAGAVSWKVPTFLIMCHMFVVLYKKQIFILINQYSINFKNVTEQNKQNMTLTP